MSFFSRILTSASLAACLSSPFALLEAQDAAAAKPAAKPADTLRGEITAIDVGAKTITVKDDATKASVIVDLAVVRTILRVPPGEKDPKKFIPIRISDLDTGDRVALRGRKGEADAKPFEAVSVLLMTAGDLEKKRLAEIADWQKRGSTGTLVTVDIAAKTAVMSARTAEGPKEIALSLPAGVQFIRYSPASVRYADANQASSISELRPGDQVRVLGTKSDDGQSIVVERMISGAFRTVPATIASISPDGKEIKITDLRNKQPVVVTLTDESAVRRLPAMMAQMLALRVNPRAAGAAGGAAMPVSANANQAGGTNPAGNRSGPPAGAQGGGQAAPGGAGGGRGNSDLTQMVERLPKIPVSELKVGDAVVVSGGSQNDGTLTAINIIAGVEALFVSAPPQSSQSGGGGSWNLDISNIGGPGGLQ